MQAHEKMLNIINHQGKANQKHNETSHLSEWLFLKRTQITNMCEDIGEREISYTVMRLQIGAGTV